MYIHLTTSTLLPDKEPLRWSLARQLDGDLDAVFVCVGGGGLLAGVSGYLKSLFPGVQIIAVEPEDAPTFYEARKHGGPITLESVGRFADGSKCEAFWFPKL